MRHDKVPHDVTQVSKSFLYPPLFALSADFLCADKMYPRKRFYSLAIPPQILYLVI
jgi:hypothetical protein